MYGNHPHSPVAQTHSLTALLPEGDDENVDDDEILIPNGMN